MPAVSEGGKEILIQSEVSYGKDGKILLRGLINLFLASLVTLYFELLTIRYLSTEVRAFTNLKNLPLVASFFGIGLGMMLGKPGRALRYAFPITALFLFLPIRYASLLHLTAVDLTWNYGVAQGAAASFGLRALYAIRFLTIVLAFLVLVVVFFVVLGGFVGDCLKRAPPLRAYGINLVGSLVGIALFSVLAFFNSRPAVWLLVGLALLVPFFVRERISILLLALVLGAVAVPEPNTLWSPYYRIDFNRLPSQNGRPYRSVYSVVANHAWYQGLVDLSPGALGPAAEANPLVLPQYELPYLLVPTPNSVLILGAGTGNDVAAALRHGAEHVDAVEIDPEILRLGRQYHPEHPYSSPRVTAYVNDARAYLKSTRKKYDLVVFGLLDSTTLLSSLSSLRLDNYVYTLESFRNARDVLANNGTLVLSFVTGRNFATDRLYATLEKAFGVPPTAYLTRYGANGILLVEGRARDTRISWLPEISSELNARTAKTILATDEWPFLYLVDRSIPGSILVVSALFLLSAWMALRKIGLGGWRTSPSYLHFFFLGAGFLLLETKAITELSLLFGSTWIVNSVVIGAFLLMALLSNGLVSFCNIPEIVSYGSLLLLLALDLRFPYSLLNSASPEIRVLVGGGWVALPVFFSGIIFSNSLKDFGRPAEVLGINLFGAVVGGILENAVMVGGTPVLSVLAIILYVCAAIVLLLSLTETRNRSMPLASAAQ
jgi:hypothetical protein